MYKHFEYTEMLARELKAIAHTDDDRHYYRATEETALEELNANIRSMHGMVMIAIDGADSNFQFSGDSLMAKPIYKIVIVQQTKSSDTDTIFAAQQASKEAIMQVIARIGYDAHRRQHRCDLIEKNSFRISGVGPLADNFYGVTLAFSLAEGVNYKLNPEMWL